MLCCWQPIVYQTPAVLNNEPLQCLHAAKHAAQGCERSIQAVHSSGICSLAAIRLLYALLVLTPSSRSMISSSAHILEVQLSR
jgi:hypothetical protein